MKKEQDLKYPFMKAFAQPFLSVFENFFVFSRYALLCALVFSMLAFLFKQTLFCSAAPVSSFLSCMPNVGFYVVYLFLKIFVLSVLIKIFYDGVCLKKTVNFLYLKEHGKFFLKMFVAFVVFLLLNMIPIFSFFVLSNRVPNPVWQKEVVFFVAVSVGFWVPFLLMRFYANVAAFIEQVPLLKISDLWQKTRLKTSKIVLSFALLSLSLFVLMIFLSALLKFHLAGQGVVLALVAEFLFEIILVFVVCVLVGFMKVQKDLFY